MYPDSTIIGLAVYQKLAKIKYAQAMLAVLASLDKQVPASSTYCKRKQSLVVQIILAVKQLCTQQQAQSVKQHLDSKKVEVIDVARAKRTKLAGAYGYDHIHQCYFYGFRLHALVNNQGKLCRVLLRPANEHDVTVAPRLLNPLTYTIITADKGYISQDLKASLAKQAVHLVTPRQSNQLPPPKSERKLYKGHRIVETAFSSLDSLGLADRPYRSTLGLILHVYTTMLAYQLQDILKTSSAQLSSHYL
ncbi:MAG: IS982 family transposase [Deinococcota bacterium]